MIHKLLAVYDNPRYDDRYTVVVKVERPGYYRCLATSDNGSCQWLSVRADAQLGTAIEFEDLPSAVQKAVRRELARKPATPH